MRSAHPGADPSKEGPGGAQHLRGEPSTERETLGPKVPVSGQRGPAPAGPARDGRKGRDPGLCEAQVPPGQDSQRQSLGGERSVEGERGSCVPEGTEVTPLNL